MTTIEERAEEYVQSQVEKNDGNTAFQQSLMRQAYIDGAKRQVEIDKQLAISIFCKSCGFYGNCAYQRRKMCDTIIEFRKAMANYI